MTDKQKAFIKHVTKLPDDFIDKFGRTYGPDPIRLYIGWLNQHRLYEPAIFEKLLFLEKNPSVKTINCLEQLLIKKTGSSGTILKEFTIPSTDITYWTYKCDADDKIYRIGTKRYESYPKDGRIFAIMMDLGIIDERSFMLFLRDHDYNALEGSATNVI